MTWDEAVALFEQRGLSKEIWQNLYEGEYILYTGNATVDGSFPLNQGEEHPWGEDWDIGFIVDGDLTVSGGVYDFDDGAAALVVLGDLRAQGFYTTCDPKVIVTGNTSLDVVFGEYTDKYLVFRGDLRAAVQVWNGECAPDEVGGTLAGSLVAPSYAELGAATVADSGVPVSELLVPEVFDGDRIDGEALLDRLVSGEPVLVAKA